MRLRSVRFFFFTTGMELEYWLKKYNKELRKRGLSTVKGMTAETTLEGHRKIIFRYGRK